MLTFEFTEIVLNLKEYNKFRFTLRFCVLLSAKQNIFKYIGYGMSCN